MSGTWENIKSMRILLLGEFSSFHKYLKEGLLQLGDHSVNLVSGGDSWKKIGGADYPIYSINPNGKNRVRAFLKNMNVVRTLKDYDVVQFINTNVYPAYYNNLIIKNIKRQNNCIALLSAGNDYALERAYEAGKFEYYIFDYAPNTSFDNRKLRGKMQIKSALYMEKSADIVIPISYEYELGYDTNKLYRTLPIPINVDDVEYQENVVNGKIVFFHGLSRELVKGTYFIKQALERLQHDYPDEVEVIIEGHMPFEQYLNFMKKTNVVIDQCQGYGYGVNACLAMAQGKVVLSGFRQECFESLGFFDCPGIHIRPDVEQIYQQLRYIVEHKKDIPEWGYKSRKYIEKHHHYVKVAQRYVEAWKTTGKL